MRVAPERIIEWSEEEVLKRWSRLFTGSMLLQKYLADASSLTASERSTLSEVVEVYRKRLFDISWFMRVLNESIARQANAEDGVKGRFW